MVTIRGESGQMVLNYDVIGGWRVTALSITTALHFYR